MRNLLLDILGDGTREGCRVVETELDFVRALQGDSSPLLVRGKSLCRWALALWEARGWPVERLFSPVDELLWVCPDLSREQAQMLLEHNRSALTLVPRPLSMRRVSEAVFPSDLWRQFPSPQHAARWLLWLDDHDPPDFAAPILRAWTLLWRAQAKGPERAIYDAMDASGARMLLATWLGYAEDDRRLDLPAFPVEVPPKLLQAAERVWMPRIIQTRGRYFDGISKRPLPMCMLEKAAEMAFQYYCTNPAHLTEEAVRSLVDHISSSQLLVLRKILPPPIPRDQPQDPSGTLTWFNEEYLPYKQWAMQSENLAASEKARSLAAAFVSWYLSYYPRAIANGDENVIYFRSARVQAHVSDGIILLVILDGLNVADATVLMRQIVTRQQRMTLSLNGLAFAPVPTVTEICKPAVSSGCAPRDVSRRTPNPRVRVLPEGKDPTTELAGAKPGEIFVWTLAEPDKTYHGKADAKTILHQVEGVLQACAVRIAEACQRVPSHLNLKVIVTTDHGRLLGDSSKSHPVPQGMISHQRAAWGRCDLSFSASGINLDASGQIAYLNGPRFGMSDVDHCAVVLTDAAFQTNDGRAGVDHFPHGGLFPEEVVVPWFEMLRDVEIPPVTCTASGKAKEGSEGQVTVGIVNPSQIELRVLALSLVFGKKRHEISLNQSIPALCERALVVAIREWPSKHEALAGTATARLRMPTGSEFSVEVELDMDSEGFYIRGEDILGDLS